MLFLKREKNNQDLCLGSSVINVEEYNLNESNGLYQLLSSETKEITLHLFQAEEDENYEECTGIVLTTSHLSSVLNKINQRNFCFNKYFKYFRDYETAKRLISFLKVYSVLIRKNEEIVGVLKD